MKKRTDSKIHVLMCASDIHTAKGGMVTVVKNYFSWEDWGEFRIMFVPTHISAGRIRKSLYFFAAFFRILWTCMREGVDIAHLHTAERGSFFRKAILVRLLHTLRIKTVMHHHAAEFEPFYEGLGERGKRFVKDTMEMADLNLVLSAGQIDAYRVKAPAGRFEVLYNAVYVPERNPYRPEASALLFLGRLGERKGTYDFLEALAEIDRELPPEIKVYLCGDGETEETAAMAGRLGLKERIGQIGWVDGGRKVEILKITGVNVLPSYYEGLPMTILETMALGIPNVSTGIASIPEVIKDGHNGYLIQPGDKKALSDRILRLAKDTELRQELGQNAWLLMKKDFSIGNHVEQLKSYYRSLIDI